jgi:hypothetical protein
MHTTFITWLEFALPADGRAQFQTDLQVIIDAGPDEPMRMAGQLGRRPIVFVSTTKTLSATTPCPSVVRLVGDGYGDTLFKRECLVDCPMGRCAGPDIAVADSGVTATGDRVLVSWFVPFEQVSGLRRCFCCTVESVSGSSKNLFRCITQSVMFLALQPNQAARYFDFRFTLVLAFLKSLADFSLNCFQVSVHFQLRLFDYFTEF